MYSPAFIPVLIQNKIFNHRIVTKLITEPLIDMWHLLSQSFSQNCVTDA